MILICRHVLNLPIIDLHDKLEVGLIFMFSSKSGDELVHEEVVIGEVLWFLPGEVDEYPGVDWGDAVEDGFGEVHLPFGYPWGDDLLHFCFGINQSIIILLALPDLFLIHRQDVKGLIKFDPLAYTNIFRMIFVYHSFSFTY